jgi:hypothetical protein
MSHSYENLIRMTSTMQQTNSWRGTLLFLALACPILWLPGHAFAQASDTGGPEAQTPHRYKTQSIDDRVRLLAKSLDLSESQQSAVKTILEQRQQQTLRIRRDPSISGSARIERFRSLQDSTVARIRAVLNEEQKENYDPLASRKIQKTPERGVEDWIKASTPH